jgi:hypothetical protein
MQNSLRSVASVQWPVQFQWVPHPCAFLSAGWGFDFEVASPHKLVRVKTLAAGMKLFTRRIPPSGITILVLLVPDLNSRRAGEARTNLSYCNGEIGPGSSNITLYIVWPYERPRQIAHTLQHMPALRVRKSEGGKNRESGFMLSQLRR